MPNILMVAGPPFWPLAKCYNRYISFNDGCMVDIMRLLQDVTDAKPPSLREQGHAASRAGSLQPRRCLHR